MIMVSSVITIANQWLSSTGRSSGGLANRCGNGCRLRRTSCFGAISVYPSDLFQSGMIRHVFFFSFFFFFFLTAAIFILIYGA
jgi:hypothetical protein